MPSRTIPIYNVSFKDMPEILVADWECRYPSDLEQLVANLFVGAISDSLKDDDAEDLWSLILDGMRLDARMKVGREENSLYLVQGVFKVGDHFQSCVNNVVISSKGHFTTSTYTHIIDGSAVKVIALESFKSPIQSQVCGLHLRTDLQTLNKVLNKLTTVDLPRSYNRSSLAIDTAIKEFWSHFPSSSGALVKFSDQGIVDEDPALTKVRLEFVPKGVGTENVWSMLPDFCTFSSLVTDPSVFVSDVVVKVGDLEHTEETRFWISNRLKDIGHYICKRESIQPANYDLIKDLKRQKFLPYYYGHAAQLPDVAFEGLVYLDDLD